MTHSGTRRTLTAGIACWCGIGSSCNGWGAERTPARASPEADAARTFRALRGVRGHFEGGAWNDAVDRWQGAKHRAMQALAGQMLREHATAARLRRAMGAPDAVLAPESAAAARAIRGAQWHAGTPPPGREAGTLWLYRWRAGHDQLAWALHHDRVVAAGWLYQWE